jgi:hypothetical protein
MLGQAWMEIDPALGGRAPGHVVYFYQNDAALAATVARFLAAGWRTRQPLVVLATARHREAIADSLSALGCDCRSGDRNGAVTFADTDDTLSSFMTAAGLDTDKFKISMERLFEQSRRESDRRRVLFYGEMVDVLWRDGHPRLALQLEEQWNGLACGRSFSLLCGYAIDRFADPDQAPAFDAVCHLHEHVIDGVHR